MIIGNGIDIVEIKRIRKLIDNYSPKNYGKIFTIKEITYCEQYKSKKYEHFAAKFAAKEAFTKATGKGFNNLTTLKNVEIVNNQDGKPEIVLHGRTKEEYGRYKTHLSVSHSGNYAIANVIIEKIEV